MQRRMNKKGMTLVELMAVIVVIGLLASILAFFVSGNNEARAQVDLSNDITTLLQAQRTRAATMNVAAYVRFSSSTTDMYVEPRLGKTSACIGSLEQQLPILYTDPGTGSVDNDGASNGNIVRIDLYDPSGGVAKCSAEYVAAGGGSRRRFCRTLESNNDTRFSGNATIGFDLKQLDGANADAPDSNLLVVCFQPNGQAYFIDGKGWRDDISTANITVKGNALGDNTLSVSVTNLGMIYSSRR